MTSTAKKHSGILIFNAVCIILLIVVLLVISGINPVSTELDTASFSLSSDGEQLQSEPITLPAGSYTLFIDYSAAEDLYVTPSSVMPRRSRYLRSGSAIMSHFRTSLEYDFDARFDTEGFVLLISGDSTPDISLDNVLLVTNHDRYLRWWLAALAALVIADLYLLWFRKADAEARRRALILLGIAALTSLPLFTPGIHAGDDIHTHLLRIDAIAEELSRGQFPVRMESLWLCGYGYPIAIMYGDLLLYPAALIRMCGFGTVSAYKLFLLLLNISTAFISFSCFRRIFRDERRSVLLTLIYMTAGYHLTDLYVRSAAGEACALLFLPIVAAGMWEIYSDSSDRSCEKADPWLLLGGGMGGIIATHILSAEMTIVVLLISAVVMWKRTFRKSTVISLIKAVVFCVLISAFFTVPFLDSYLREDFAAKHGFSQEYYLGIQSDALHLTELFQFFRDAVGEYSGFSNGRMMLTPGIFLMAALIISIWLWINGKADTGMKYLCIISGAVIFLSCDLFPWDLIAEKSSAGLIFAQMVQFPWRYICPLLPVLTLLCGCLLERSAAVPSLKWVSYAAVIGSILMTCYFTGQLAEHSTMVFYKDSAEIDTIGPALDVQFALDNVNADELYDTPVAEGLSEFTVLERRGTDFVISAASSDGGFIELPVFAYRNYRAVDKNGSALSISSGDNARLRIEIPAGFEGSVLTSYKAPWHWYAALLISLITAVAADIFTVRRRAAAVSGTGREA